MTVPRENATRTIYTLRPNVEREDAIEQFSGARMLGRLGGLISGPLRSVADVYVPSHVFEVHIEGGRAQQRQLLAIDLISAAFDLYMFDELLDESKMISIETANAMPVRLALDEAERLLIDRVRRFVFRGGFFRVTKALSITACPVASDFHVPYWVGFRGRSEEAQIVVLDAVRRRMEGAKVRNAIREWLTS